MKQARRSVHALLYIAVLITSLVAPSGTASATSDFDDLLQVSPSLYVYTDGSTKTQTMDISESWFNDLGQTYAKRVAQNIGWPTNFMTELDAIRVSGSLGVLMHETPDGNVVEIFGSRDPNALLWIRGQRKHRVV